MRHFTKLSAAAVMMMAAAPFASGADFVWDGTTDSDWFGANWTVSATTGQLAADEDLLGNNAKIFDYYSDANAVDVFNGDDTFTIGAGATIDNFATGTGVAYFHDNTVVTVDQASVRLFADLWLPTKVLDNSTLTATDSTLHFTRGNNSGNAFVIGDTAVGGSTPSVSIDNTAMTVDQWDPTANGGLGADEGGNFEMYESGTFSMTNGSTLTVSNNWLIDDNSSATVDGSLAAVTVNANTINVFDTATLDVDDATITTTGQFNVNSSGATVTIDDSTINAGAFRNNGGATVTLNNVTINGDLTNQGGSITNFNNVTINAAGEEYFNGADASVVNANNVNITIDAIRTNELSSWNFDTGTITLNAANPLRSNNGFTNDFNWIGDVGDGTITHTNLTGSNTQNLAGKIAQGYFLTSTGLISIPRPTTTPTGPIAANVDALNAELASLIVNSKYFFLDATSSPGSTDPDPPGLTGHQAVADRRRWRLVCINANWSSDPAPCPARLTDDVLFSGVDVHNRSSHRLISTPTSRSTRSPSAVPTRVTFC